MPCCPPPWTAAMSRVAPVSVPRGATSASTITTTTPAAAPNAGQSRRCAGVRSTHRAEREAELEHDPRQQDHAADPGHDDQRPAGLADAHAGQRHAAERPREAQRLDERVRRRAPDDPPAPGRRDERGEAVEAGEHQRRGDVAGHGELPHPAHAHGQPPERRTGTRATSGRRGDGSTPSDSSNRATPTNASGQNPHGGIDRATRNPAPSASAGWASRLRRRLMPPGRGAPRSARAPTRAGGRRTAWRWPRASGRRPTARRA